MSTELSKSTDLEELRNHWPPGVEIFELAAKLSSLRVIWPTDLVRAIIELKAVHGWSDEFALLLMGQITDIPEMGRRWVAYLGVSLGAIPKGSVSTPPPREEEAEADPTATPSAPVAIMLAGSVLDSKDAEYDPNYR